jgi:phosphopantothenoylcysteine decarboxylase/phosphopantothenate--cysteine ligase
MGGDRNQVHLITAKGEESWPEMTKIEVAQRLVRRIVRQFQGNAA